jgi:hypothetical protein
MGVSQVKIKPYTGIIVLPHLAATSSAVPARAPNVVPPGVPPGKLNKMGFGNSSGPYTDVSETFTRNTDKPEEIEAKIAQTTCTLNLMRSMTGAHGGAVEQDKIRHLEFTLKSLIRELDPFEDTELDEHTGCLRPGKVERRNTALSRRSECLG